MVLVQGEILGKLKKVELEEKKDTSKVIVKSDIVTLKKQKNILQSKIGAGIVMGMLLAMGLHFTTGEAETGRFIIAQIGFFMGFIAFFLSDFIVKEMKWK